MKRRLAVAIFSVLAFAGIAAPAAQATPDGLSTQITDFSPGRGSETNSGQFHATAVNPKTGAQIVLYRANNGDDAYLGTQRFDGDGPVGAEHVIATGANVAQNNWQYAIAYNPTTGGWLAAYADYDGDQILGQLLKADGSTSGSSFVIGTISSPEYAGVDISWNSKSKKFLVAFTSYYDVTMEARFVKGGGAVSGAQFTVMSGLSGSDYVPMDTAYSSKSNTFLVEAYDSPDPASRTRVQLLSGSGSPIGSDRYLGTAEDNYAASVAYNAKRDEFGVVWISQPVSSGPYFITLQRIKASDGVDVGGEVEITPPEGMEVCCYRPFLSSSPSGQYYVATYLNPGTSPYDSGWFAFEFSGTGETVADSLDETGNGLYSGGRPQTLYNPVTRRFVNTNVSYECVPTPLSTTRSTRGGPCTDYYNLYSNGGSALPSGSKPTLKKLGTPGGTSARVKLGCGGSGKCKIKLTGKLKGGSGKIVPQTVKVKAGKKSKVKVIYSQDLIDELAANGGGKIKLTAKRVGGKSKTIILTVPASVTG